MISGCRQKRGGRFLYSSTKKTQLSLLKHPYITELNSKNPGVPSAEYV